MRKIEMGPVPYDVFVATQTEYKGFLRKQTNNEIEIPNNDTIASAMHFEHPVNGGFSCVVLDIESIKKLDRIEQIRVCFHEAVHVLQQVNDRLMERNPGREYEANLVDYIGAKILEYLDFRLSNKNDSAE